VRQKHDTINAGDTIESLGLHWTLQDSRIMAQILTGPFTHTDIELMRLRMKLSPGQRLQAMLDARALVVGIIRGRLQTRYPELSDQEINLKILEEIERAQRIRARPHSFSRYSAEA
jgi:hypothetical protein